MIVIENQQVRSTEGKFIHRKGTQAYVTQSMVLPTDTEDMYEEVDEIPVSEEPLNEE